MESKLVKSDGDKLAPAPVDLSKLSDAVKDDVVKKDEYNAKTLEQITSLFQYVERLAGI